MSFLHLEKIHYHYFSADSVTTALQDISFSIQNGELISVIGPSGCGKTTLLSILSGLSHPTSGTVTLEGNDITTRNTTIGYMLQQDYLFPWKTIEENILLGLKITNTLTEQTKNDALELLDTFNVKHVRHQYPSQLSGGMRQRVALARTMAIDPKLLLLDEPFSALDYQTKLKLEDFVFDILKSFKKTAVLVTHDIGEAIAMSDRIFLFSSQPGKLHRVFTVPDELRKLRPFLVRSQPSYHTLFQSIWKEMEILEQGNSTSS